MLPQGLVPHSLDSASRSWTADLRQDSPIDICDWKGPCVSFGWSPALRDTAYVLHGFDFYDVDAERLTDVVRRFLEKHGY